MYILSRENRAHLYSGSRNTTEHPNEVTMVRAVAKWAQKSVFHGHSDWAETDCCWLCGRGTRQILQQEGVCDFFSLKWSGETTHSTMLVCISCDMLEEERWKKRWIYFSLLSAVVNSTKMLLMLLCTMISSAPNVYFLLLLILGQ